jgi:hypothetical protein
MAEATRRRSSAGASGEKCKGTEFLSDEKDRT